MSIKILSHIRASEKLLTCFTRHKYLHRSFTSCVHITSGKSVLKRIQNITPQTFHQYNDNVRHVLTTAAQMDVHEPKFIISAEEIDQVEDPLLHSIYTAETIDGVLTTMFSPKQMLEVHHIVVSLQRIDYLLYESFSKKPWACSGNKLILSLQMSHNFDNQVSYQPLLSNPRIAELITTMGRLVPQLDNLLLTSAGLALVRLFVPLHHEAITAILLECEKRIDELDLNQLAMYAEIANYMRRSGFPASILALQKFQTHWEEFDVDDPVQVRSVAWLFSNVAYFATEDFLCKVMDKILSKHGAHINAENAVLFLEGVVRFIKTDQKKYVAGLLPFIVQGLDTLNNYQFARVPVFLNISHSLHLLTSDAIIMRANALLQSDKAKASEIASLCTLYNAIGLSNELFSKLQQQLEDNIGEFDVILLKTISHCPTFLAKFSPDVSRVYYRRVIMKLPDLMGSISCLIEVVKCLSKSTLSNSNLDEVISSAIVYRVLNEGLTTTPSHIALFGRYVLSRSLETGQPIKGEFIELLLANLPQFDIGDLTNLALGLETAWKQSSHAPYSSHNRIKKQLKFFTGKIAMAILQKKDAIGNLNMLTVITQAVLGRVGLAQSGYDMEELLVLFRGMAGEIKAQNLRPLGLSLKNLQVYEEFMLEKIMRFAMENVSTILSGDFVTVLETAGYMGHCPVDVDELKVAVDVFLDICYHRKDVLNVVRAGLALAHLQIPHDKLLQHVFTVDFMETFDSLCQDKQSGFVMKLYRQLMELNRYVVLEYPALDVPWFHDPGVRYHYPRHGNSDGGPSYRHWQEQTYQALSSCLGGEHVVKLGPIQTAYHHIIDFEITVDQYSNPVPVSEAYRNPHAQRVAVLILTPSSYFSNQRRLTGSKETHIRQLEILGYKVIKIPHFELSSMYLTDQNAWQRHLLSSILQNKMTSLNVTTPSK